MTLLRASVVTLAVLLGPGLARAQAALVERLDLTFGVYTSDKATTMYRMFTPVLEHLQERLERQLHRSVDTELRIYKTYDEALDAFVAGKVDFVRFGPASYVLALARNPKIQLLAVELKGGKKTFKGMVVVRQDSPIQRLSDLRGRSFAFGDRNSTIGRYLAQDTLLEAKIWAQDLSYHAYLGRHDRVFRAVQYGDYDAGSVKENTYQKLNKKNQLRALARFDNVTNPWIARSGLDPRVTAALRSALLGANDKKALASLKVDGFVTATDKDFSPIRDSMKRAETF
ncbi:MAG: PhnD/SsuA/transferrin family substrate-binding protein, partial [Planctomycetota bacterium]